jgi:hypothetical protein
MSFAAPRALPENAGLVFAGERVARTSSIPDKMADQMLRTPNRNGRPNGDVLRQIVSAANRHRPEKHWQIDFSRTMGEREASLYEHPFDHLRRTLRPTQQGWWHNPHADEALRAALAKRERYLATPLGATPPEFSWFESAVIPDDTLIAVARDDDYTHGVLASPLFATWWCEVHSRRTPALALQSFPFPWPPATLLSALTAAQEEHRLAISRAARGSDSAALQTAVLAAYGWSAGSSPAELLEKLLALNRARVG